MHVGAHVAADSSLARKQALLLSRPLEPFPVLTAKVKLTWDCNLRCGVCRIWRRRGLVGNHTLEQGAVESLVKCLAERGLKKIQYSGGEVFLVEWLPALLRYSVGLGLQVNITTNGTLLDKQAAKMVVRERVKAVNFSIDSPKRREHDAMRGKEGAWRATVQGLENLLAARSKKGRGPKIGVNTVVTRRNFKRLPRLYSMLKEMGVERWRLIAVDTEEAGLRPSKRQWWELNGLFSQWRDLLIRTPAWPRNRGWEKMARNGRYACGFYGDRTCFAPWFHLFVDADGAAFTCCGARGGGVNLGNLAEDGPEGILDGAARAAVKEMFASGRRFDVCDRCDLFLEENELLNKMAMAHPGPGRRGG